MVLKQKETSFFVLEASEKIIPNKVFSISSPSGSFKSPSSRSPDSAIFALTDMQHARGRRRTSAVEFTSAVSGFYFCREVTPFCCEFNIRFSSELFVFGCVFRFCLELKIWFCRESFWLCRELFGCAVRYLVVPREFLVVP